MSDNPKITKEDLLCLPISEKLKRFNKMVETTFSHIDSHDLLAELHPRHELDIKRRMDGREMWFDGDWLTTLMQARDGRST